jgi:hypothetical protein
MDWMVTQLYITFLFNKTVLKPPRLIKTEGKKQMANVIVYNWQPAMTSRKRRFFGGSGKNRGISTHRFTNKNRYIDNDVIKFLISPKMDIDMSKNGSI